MTSVGNTPTTSKPPTSANTSSQRTSSLYTSPPAPVSAAPLSSFDSRHYPDPKQTPTVPAAPRLSDATLPTYRDSGLEKPTNGTPRTSGQESYLKAVMMAQPDTRVVDRSSGDVEANGKSSVPTGYSAHPAGRVPYSHSLGTASPSLPRNVTTASSTTDIIKGPAQEKKLQPPYTAPAATIYPSDSVPNPYRTYMAHQPVYNDFPRDTLYRPARIPDGLQDRISLDLVWMRFEEGTGEARYYVPPVCVTCETLHISDLCDRASPMCNRCKKVGRTCILGSSWAALRPPTDTPSSSPPVTSTTHPNGQTDLNRSTMGFVSERDRPAVDKGKSRESLSSTSHSKAPQTNDVPISQTLEDAAGANLAERRLSAEEKGKGRATEIQGDTPAITNGFEEDIGRGKRVKKKRRLSATGEIDPQSVNDRGTVVKRRKQAAAASISQPPEMEGPLSVEDQRYFARIKDNETRPRLSEMKGTCPVWSTTRRGLQAGTEYLRNPSRTAGASVEIGVGGVARGLILEGLTASTRHFWGVQGDAGTLVVPIGNARARRTPTSDQSRPIVINGSIESVQEIANPSAIRSTTPPINILPSVVDLAKTTATSPIKAAEPAPKEAKEVSSLLMAQRARTPVAIAVAQDYPFARFKVPRPYIVLGWFWVIDAWVEPLYENETSSVRDRVVWKFRFSICDTSPSACWWQHKSEPSAAIVPEPSSPFDTQKTWSLDPVHGSLSTTLNLDVSQTTAVTNGDNPNAGPYRCPKCRAVSDRVYFCQDICLNELCEAWFIEAATSSTSGRERAPDPKLAVPGAITSKVRIRPEQLGLTLRPPEPNVDSVEISRKHAGREYWRGWVCRNCGMANERRKWHGWDCEACGNYILPKRKEWTEEQLRPPSRPVAKGARQDEGFPNWPFSASRAWTLFTDDLKVIRHGVEEGFGEGAEIFHALNHEGTNAHLMARKVLKDLQVQGSQEVPLRRYQQNKSSRRPAERVLSSFYTLLCGPEPVPANDALPCSKPIPWKDASPCCLDIADLINERAGRMFPGEPERFNSLLIVASPPETPSSAQPRIYITPRSYFAILFLGSDGSVKFRRAALGERVGKQGELTVQHGDVIGIKTGDDGIEVQPSQEGFGFFCLARQIYRDDQDDEDAVDSGDFNANGKSNGTVKVNGNGNSTAPTRIKSKMNRPPIKPAKLLEVPLTFWYIGPYPLDSTQPIRALPPLRYRPPTATTATASKGDQPAVAAVAANTGIETQANESTANLGGRLVEIITTPQPALTTLDPPGGIPGSMQVDVQAETPSRKHNGKGKGKAAEADDMGSAIEVDESEQPSGAGAGAGTRKHKRKSGINEANPPAIDLDNSEVVESQNDVVVTPSATKKKKRKSLVAKEALGNGVEGGDNDQGGAGADTGMGRQVDSPAGGVTSSPSGLIVKEKNPKGKSRG